MAPVVTDFIDDMAARGWQWGERDCLLWLGLWSERVTGIDGGEPWRGRYRTALGCARTLNASGGMAACIERGARLCGMTPTTEFRAGDIGLVKVMTERGVKDAGAICTGPRWAVWTQSGIVSARADASNGWRF